MFAVTTASGLHAATASSTRGPSCVEAVLVLEYDPLTLSLVVKGLEDDVDGWTPAFLKQWNACVYSRKPVVRRTLLPGLDVTFLLEPSQHDGFVFGESGSIFCLLPVVYNHVLIHVI